MNNIDISKWKKFKISDIFECKTTKAVSSEDVLNGDTIYITRSATLNGFSGNIPYDKKKINKGNCITIGAEGVVAFYQEDDFLAGVKVYTLRNNNLNKYNALFICTLLNTEKYRYSYGRARVLEKLKNEEILLPQDENGNPDFNFMEKYIKSLWGGSHTTSIQYSNIDLKIEKWKEFELQELFDIKYGVNLELINLTQSTGNQAINFVSRTGSNNGVVAKVLPVEGIEPQEAGLISVASGGSVLSTFYQDEPFYSGRDLYILKEKVPMSKLTKLFLCTVLKKNAYRYAYGRQANKTLKNIIVKVPVDSKGVIDDKYITNFMSKLQYSDMI